MNRIAHFHILKEISKNVYKIQHRQSQLQYSLRVLQQNQMQPLIDIIKKLGNYDGLQVIIDVWYEQGKAYILSQWENGGDLQEGNQFSEQEIWQCCIQLSNALKYIHEQGIIHRDLKPANIFIGSNGQYCIGDFESAAFDDGLQITQFGTPLFLAPEVIRKEFYDNKIDIWALGCILFMMASKQPPFTGKTLQGLQYNIIYRGFTPLSKQHYSTEFRNLIDSLLNKNKIKRPNLHQIIAISEQNLQTIKNGLKITDQKEQNNDNNIPKELKVPITPIMDTQNFFQIDESFELTPQSSNKNIKQTPKIKILKKESYQSRQRPLTAQTQYLSPNNEGIRLPTSETERYKQYIPLLQKIQQARPNSAINFSGKQYIQNSLYDDAQKKRLQMQQNQNQPSQPKRTLINSSKHNQISLDSRFLDQKTMNQDNSHEIIDTSKNNIQTTKRPCLKIKNLLQSSIPLSIHHSQKIENIKGSCRSGDYNSISRADLDKRNIIQKQIQQWQNRFLSTRDTDNQ